MLILKKSNEMDKAAKILSPTYNKGPHRILKAFNNGTVKILQDTYTEIINARRFIPSVHLNDLKAVGVIGIIVGVVVMYHKYCRID